MISLHLGGLSGCSCGNPSLLSQHRCLLERVHRPVAILRHIFNRLRYYRFLLLYIGVLRRTATDLDLKSVAILLLLLRSFCRFKLRSTLDLKLTSLSTVSLVLGRSDRFCSRCLHSEKLLEVVKMGRLLVEIELTNTRRIAASIRARLLLLSCHQTVDLLSTLRDVLLAYTQCLEHVKQLTLFLIGRHRSSLVLASNLDNF